MTRKSCLNCAYLCRDDLDGNQLAWSASDRNGDNGDRLWETTECYLLEWERKHYNFIGNSGKSLDVTRRASASTEDNRYRFIIDANNEIQSLDALGTNCGNHLPFDPKSSKPLNRLWEEQKQQKQDCRFRITTLLAAIVAIAVVISAFFHMLDWWVS